MVHVTLDDGIFVHGSNTPYHRVTSRPWERWVKERVMVTECSVDAHSTSSATEALHLDVLPEVSETAEDWNTVHPLLRAAHLSSTCHLPLVLSPQSVWITIIQGISEFMRIKIPPAISKDARAQQYETPCVTKPDPETSPSWVTALNDDRGGGIRDRFLERWCAAHLTPQIKANMYQLSFSTSCKEEESPAFFASFGEPFRAASTTDRIDEKDGLLGGGPDPPPLFVHAVPKDENRGAAPPFIKLLGNKTDWDSLARMTFTILKDLPGADKWKRAVVPVLAKFASTFDLEIEGDNLDEENRKKLAAFWKRMCKFTTTSIISPGTSCTVSRGNNENEENDSPDNEHDYHDDGIRKKGVIKTKVSGWILRLFPSLFESDQEVDNDEYDDEDEDRGIDLEDVPSGMATTPFLAETRHNDAATETFDMSLTGGLLGISIAKNEHSVIYVVPEVGWVVGRVKRYKPIPSNKLGSVFIRDSGKIREVVNDFFIKYDPLFKAQYPQFLTALNTGLGESHRLPKNSISPDSFKRAQNDIKNKN